MSNFSIHSFTAASAFGALMRPRMAAGVPLMREISQVRVRGGGFFAMPQLCGNQM
jgi:hypothetical protein